MNYGLDRIFDDSRESNQIQYSNIFRCLITAKTPQDMSLSGNRESLLRLLQVTHCRHCQFCHFGINFSLYSRITMDTIAAHVNTDDHAVSQSYLQSHVSLSTNKIDETNIFKR